MVKERSYRRNRFAIQYQARDVELLAAVDEAHETLSGPATQKILYREFYDYGDERYERLATISAPHIYNLRKSRVYRERRIIFQKTRPVMVTIGERRRPDPQGRPGVLADRHGTSRGSGRHQGGVPRQCRGRGDAVAGGGRDGVHH